MCYSLHGIKRSNPPQVGFSQNVKATFATFAMTRGVALCKDLQLFHLGLTWNEIFETSSCARRAFFFLLLPCVAKDHLAQFGGEKAEKSGRKPVFASSFCLGPFIFYLFCRLDPEESPFSLMKLIKFSQSPGASWTRLSASPRRSAERKSLRQVKAWWKIRN